MTSSTSTAAPTSTPTEQCLTLAIEIETMADSDTGQLALIGSTGFHQEDLTQVSPARARGMISQAHAKLNEMMRLVDEYEAREILAAIIAEHDLTLEERDTATLDPDLRDILQCLAIRTTDGRTTIVVPAGQNPIVRTAVVAEFINDLQAAE